ncbi:hypothetical protein LZ22198_MCBDPFMK_01743 [Levilactobacillus zymae]
MTWSMWLVPPFITSIFFVLGVITLYWSIFNWITTKIESQSKPVNVKRVQAWVGAICSGVAIFALQLLVRDSHLSWTFMNFQLLILVFAAYFLQIRIPYWLIFIFGIGFMLLNGNVDQPLSWFYTGVLRYSTWNPTFKVSTCGGGRLPATSRWPWSTPRFYGSWSRFA